MRLLIFTVCLLIVFTGCIVQQPSGTDVKLTETPSASERIDKQASTPTQPKIASARYDVETYRIEHSIHVKMNEQRERQNLKPLQYSQKLASIARYKSWDMAQKDYFSHSGANGSPYSQFRIRYNSRCRFYAQNIYMNKFNRDIVNVSNELNDIDEISKNAVDYLMNSTGHRKNILDPNYQVEGIGVLVDENGTVYVTQEFCGYS